MNWPDRFAASRIWPWNRLHELKNLSPYQREAIWGECSRASGGAQRGCLLVVVAIIGSVTASVIVADYYDSVASDVPAAVDILLDLLTLGLPLLGLMTGWRLTQRAVRVRIMETYRDRRFPYCLFCGYALEGLPEEQADCPECGESVRGENAVPQISR
ncbi:MAG: hypothetical protein AAGH99_15535 [Planctomycetota bacterium]